MSSNCRNCGAPINGFGRCQYCGTDYGSDLLLIPTDVNLNTIKLYGDDRLVAEVVVNDIAKRTKRKGWAT